MKFTKSEIASMRFGYGLDIKRSNPQHKSDLLSHIATPERIPTALQSRPSVDDRIAKRDVIKSEGQGKSAKEKQKFARRSRQYLKNQLKIDAHMRLIAAVETSTPFFERLVFFWADHFSVSAKNPDVAMVALDYENTAIRPHVDGTFRDMLHAVTAHPAMLMFLDNHLSVGPNSRYIQNRKKKNLPLGKQKGLNENLGRELLELHTLGVTGGYTQADVTNASRLLTGWTVDKSRGHFRFRPEYAEPAPTVILGKKYGAKKPLKSHMEKLLDDLAVHPKTALYVCGKLARHFIADSPPKHCIDKLVDTFLKTGGDLPSVYKALLDMPESWDTFGQKTKRPFDHIVSGIKATGLDSKLLLPRMDNNKNGVRPSNFSVGAMFALDQILYHVPGPNGWADTAEAWISPQGLTFRLKWAMRIAGYSASKKGYIHNNKAKLQKTFEACLGKSPDKMSNILVTGAPNRRDSIVLALTNPTFTRR